MCVYVQLMVNAMHFLCHHCDQEIQARVLSQVTNSTTESSSSILVSYWLWLVHTSTSPDEKLSLGRRFPGNSAEDALRKFCIEATFGT